MSSTALKFSSSSCATSDSTIPSAFSEDILANYKLTAKRYNLIVARLEPENNIEMILQGYLNAEIKETMVVVGKTDTKFGKYLSEKYQSDKHY